jgi:Flp pilus assembly protein TadB
MRSLLASDRAIVSTLVGCFAHHSLSAVETRSTRSVADYCAEMLRFVSTRELRNMTLAAFLLAGILAGIFALWVGGVVLLVAVTTVWSTVKLRARSRSSAIERDLPALLTSVASSVRAGIDPLQAIVDSESYFPIDSPLVEEVRSFKLRLTTGDDEAKVVESFLARDGNRDAELFKQCLLLSRKHGSSLSEPLHRVVRVVRQHQSFKRKTRAALAMHKMSAFGIMVCALLTASLQVLMNFEGVQAAMADPRGIVLLSIGGSLIALGVFWMMRMGREEVL